MNYLCTLYTRGQDGYQDRSTSAAQLIHDCQAQGLNATRFVWTWERLQTTLLYQVYRDRFTPAHQMGYWAWKPWLILNALTQMADSDLLIMLDSDLHLTGRLEDFYPTAYAHQACFIGHGFRNDKYTTGDCFYLMGLSSEEYYGANHVWGAVNILTNCPATRAFAQDWLTCGLSLDLLLSQNQHEMNRPGFESTRHAQGLHTNLVVKYGFKILENSWASHFAHPAVPLPMGKV